MVSLGFREPPLNQIDFPRWSGDALRGLLLKHVQNVDGFLKADGVNGPPSIATFRSHDFENAGATKTSEGLGGGIDITLLGCKECVPDIDPDGTRKRPQIPE
jgi:hypothetical protein